MATATTTKDQPPCVRAVCLGRMRGMGRARKRSWQVFAGALAFVSAAWAQPSGYPSKPVRVVVPFPAGTSPDVIARFWGDRLSRATGQPFVIDNKPGASSIIGAQAVAAAAADGYTLLYTVGNTTSLNPHVYKNLPYGMADFVAVHHTVKVPYVLVTSATSPVKTVADLIAAARKKPGQLNYASGGAGTTTHVLMVRLLNEAGISMTHVPYKDGGMVDLINGTVAASFEPSTTAIPQIKGGKLRGLAVSSAQRIDVLGDVPSIAETIPGLSADSWHGVLAPRNTPAEVVSTLSALLNRVVESREFQEKARDYGLVPGGGTASEFQKFMIEDANLWGGIVRKNHIQLD